MIYEVDYQYDEGMLPEENSVNICQLHAEMDLWATRYKLAKSSRRIASLLLDELIKKYSGVVYYYQDALDRERKWEWAVEKIKSKYEKVKTAYENYFTELKVH
jgi:hypothetical protein